MPAGVLSITSPVDGADLDQLELEEAERRINEKAGDKTRKGRVLVLNASTSYQPLGAPALSEGWVSIAANARREILAVWRAPESVLGIGGNRTYENQRVELAAYYNATVLPILNLICATLTQQARRLGYVLWVDMSNVAALNEGLDEVATRAAALVAAGIVSVNEARELLGLPPVDAAEDAPEAEPNLDEGRGVSRDAAPLAGRRSIQGDEYSDRLDRAVETFETQLADYATRFHERLAKQIVGGLRRRAGVARVEGSEVPTPQVSADEIVDVDARNEELLADLGGLFEDAASAVGRVVVDALDVSASDAVELVWRELGAARLDRLVNGGTSYPGWTRQLVDDVTEAIQAAYLNGESVDGAIGRVEAVLGPERAERVARTELSGLMNEVSYRQMVDGGVERKRWYSVADNRTRDSHRELNGTTIPMGGEVHGWWCHC